MGPLPVPLGFLPVSLLLLLLRSEVSDGQIASDDLSAFVSQAHEAMAQRFYQLEPQLYNNGIRQRLGSPAWFMAHPGKPESKNITNAALMAEETTRYMAHALGLSGQELKGVGTTGTPLWEICPSHEGPWCEARKYRSLSGHCNNVQNPSWGSTGTPYRRYLAVDYADTISLPRGTSNVLAGLPSAREVSLSVHNQLDRLHSHLVATAAVWAQLIAYDVSLTPKMTGFNGERLKCCGVEFDNFHPECFPIRLPEGDPIHGSARCQEYVRSATAPRRACTLGPREQMNEATSFLDGSTLYGTSNEEIDELRLYRGGLLRMENDLLPSDNKTDCKPNDRRFSCFKSGDKRINEHIGLAGLQTVWAREHNRLATRLADLNPHWPDEILFQEARKLVIAQIQFITYHEFLPLILGKDTMAAHSLQLESDGYYKDYDINENPSIANSVASAALHFSVSLMPTQLKYYDSFGNEIGEELLSESFYAPFYLYSKNGLDSVIQSLLRTSAFNNNQHVNTIFTDHMFEQTDEAGLDLVAQLIQQGRDHGIPAYPKWRKFCGLPEPRTFEDLRGYISEEAVATLRQVYRNVSEIDLLSGALSESVPEGATVGATLRCLLAKQFKSLKRGDRHWFETEWAGFSRSQLRSLREGVSLARVICDNTEVKSIQPSAFLGQDPFLNAPMNCDSGSIKSLDLKHWKEEKKSFIIPSSVLVETLRNARSDVKSVHQQEWVLFTHNLLADPQSPVGTAFRFNRPKRQALRIANTSLMLEFASSRIVRSFIQGELQDVETRDVNSLISTLPFVDLSFIDSSQEQDCLDSDLPCDYTRKYRTVTGWCNNLEHPDYGQSYRPFVRFLSPQYTDGVGVPRSLSVTGKPLPSPRLISTNVHTDISRPHTRYSLLVMQFAQITDHDLTFTPVNKGFIGEGILNCLSCDSKTAVHPECFPIPIPDNDPYFPSRDEAGNQLCIPATRSMPGQQTLGPREQMNQLTAYLDLSFVYASDNCDAKALRSFSGGKMNVTRVGHGKPLLPETKDNAECRSKSRICFNAGDDRASEQPALGSFHTVWLREHNRIAGELSHINPHWDDEILYQETRKILGAIYQHLTFSEFLPRVLGWDAVRKYKLNLLNEGYYKGYDPTCDVTVMNEFSSAAFRFGHSLLRPGFKRMSPEYKEKESFVLLRDHFFNPEILYKPGVIDEILLGLIDTPMETLDNFITKEVTDHLFENKSRPFSGMDLISLNIQRARDHGVNPYNNYREACGLGRAKKFSDLAPLVHQDLAQILSQLYESVDDIDLFPGGMSETPLQGGVIGPTFACIIGKQFSKIRRCDRFWYENDQEFTRFTPPQLEEIRKASIAMLFCNNLDNIHTIQRAVLDLPDPFMNPRVKCKLIPQVNLNHWRERASCVVDNVSIDVGRTANTSPCVSCTCTKEGPICQTVKVRNCISLLHKFPADAVANDTACKVQCLYIFKVVQEYTLSQSKLRSPS